MSSPAWSAVVPKYRDVARRVMASPMDPTYLHRGGPSRGHIIGSAQGFWASLSSQYLVQKTTSDELHALTGSPSPYMPFHLEANTFFETPVARLQLTMHAAERFWTNPIWLRPDTIAQLKLVVAPMEAPVALWLPQCGDTYRPLSSFPPKVQHTILRDLPVPVFIHDTSHVVLALDYHRVLTELSGDVVHSNGSINVMTRPRYSWQHVTPQFAAAFDHAWAICAPQVAQQLRVAAGSRGSKREVAPKSPRAKMWVSLRCAGACHSEAHRQFYRLPVEPITVATPTHGGLFYNAAQLFSDKFIVDKTDEVMQRVRGLALNKARKAPFLTSIPASVDGAASVGDVDGGAWPPMEHSKRLFEAPSVLEDADAALDHNEHDATTPIAHHEGAEAEDMLSMDAMMLFAEPELHDEAEDHTSNASAAAAAAAGTTAAAEESQDAAAEGDLTLQRHLYADDEQHEGMPEEDGERVFVDLAAARDGDCADAYPAELELVCEAASHNAALQHPLEIEEELSRDVFKQFGQDDVAPVVPILPMAHRVQYEPNLTAWTTSVQEVPPAATMSMQPRPFGCGDIA